ncbi:MAG: SpoIIE family protein phosphatase [Bacteroidales bacterium]
MASRDKMEEKYLETTRMLERQKAELTDSINYAAYIQKAMLPSPDLFRKLLPDYFIYYKPKDIVSGDFYWLSRWKELLVLAVADCTGHGVPGGFMSVMGISFLNEIIGRGCFSNAAGILNQLRERVMKALHQTGEWDEQKDGMDIALCMIDKERHEMQFAGANNPLYLVREGTLLEFKGDKMPIGISAGIEKSFSNQRIKLEEGDKAYLFTDGYIDQFGGDSRKKFKPTPLKNLIIAHAGYPLEQQKDILEQTLLTWQNDLPQVDDILAVGFAPLSGHKKKL